MASILKDGKFDLSLFDTELNADKQSFGVSYGRTNPRPLDGTSIFRSKADAENYAATSTVAYPGQYIAVVTATGVDAYVITHDNSIRLLATGGSAEEIAANLNQEIIDRAAADNVISAALSTFIETTFPAAQTAQSTALKSELSIGFSDNSTTAGSLKTYTLTQGSNEYKIEIPKDFLVKSATVKTVTETNTPYDGAIVDDKYIDFVINSKDDTSGTGEHLYIPAKSLIDEYTGEATGTISVTVDNTTNKISATIVEKSISAAHLTDELSGVISAISVNAANALTAITAEATRATNAEGALGERIDALTADNTGILAQANAYTNSVSAALSTDYVAKIADAKGIALNYINDVSATLSGDYVAKIATAKDEATQASTGYTNTQIGNLTANLTADAGKFVNKITQNNGIVSAEFKQLEISDVSGLSDKLTSITVNVSTNASNITALNNNLTLSVNNLSTRIDGISEELIGTYATITSVAEISNTLNGQINDVDDKATQIGNSLINYALSSDVSNISTNLQNDIDTKLASTDFAALSNAIGLSAASAGDKIATQQYVTDAVAGLTGAMHFRGTVTPKEGQTVEEAITEIENPAAGDIIIVTTNSKEYVYDGENWVELGDESLYAKNTELQAEIDARRDEDNNLLNEINNIKLSAISSITLNGQDFVIDNNIASLTIDTISCGGAL